MRAVVGVVTAGLIILFWEGKSLVKKRRKKEMIIFILSLLVAETLYICVVQRVSLPTLAEMIGAMLAPVVKPILGWINGGYE